MGQVVKINLENVKGITQNNADYSTLMAPWKKGVRKEITVKTGTQHISVIYQ